MKRREYLEELSRVVGGLAGYKIVKAMIISSPRQDAPDKRDAVLELTLDNGNTVSLRWKPSDSDCFTVDYNWGGYPHPYEVR